MRSAICCKPLLVFLLLILQETVQGICFNDSCTNFETIQGICFNDTSTNFIAFSKEVGRDGRDGRDGRKGDKGEKGDPGLPSQSCNCQEKGIDNDLMIHLLNDYYVSESGYYNKIYQVTSKALTDGRSDTGGYGSKTSSAGNWIQATYALPVYVTSVHIAGGFIPSWNHDTRSGFGAFYLQFSHDNINWQTVHNLPKTVGTQIKSYPLPKPVTAQYWRLTSSQSNWIATTEFALKPLIKPQ